MDIKGIGVLVATDDLTCQNVVNKMLQHCAYRELHIGKEMDALKAIWEAKDDLYLVLTNINRLERKKPENMVEIEKMFDMEIIYMCPDGGPIRSRGKEFKVAAYFLKLSTMGDMNKHWDLAMEAVEAEQQKEIKQEGTSTTVSIDQDANSGGGGGGKSTMRIKEEKLTREKKKRKEPEEKSEQEDTNGDDSPVGKKPRMVWSKDMHLKFVEAMETLGPDKAVPKKIVEVMNMPGLTRENVASHLQKYRILLKKANAEETDSPTYGMHLPNSVRGSCYLSGQPLMCFNNSDRYSSIVNRMPFQQNPCAIGSTSAHLSTSLPSLTPAHLLAGSSSQEILNRLSYLKLSQNDTISANSDYLHLSVEQYHSASSSFQMEPNNVFQMYGDQNDNTLLTIEGENLLHNAAIPRSSIPDYSFTGLRLTDNGKSVQFGQSNISMNNDIKEETMYTSVETLQAEPPDRLYRSSMSTSYIPDPSDTMLQKSLFSSELPECHSSGFIPYTSQQTPFTTFLGTSMLENSIICPSFLADSTPQQNHHLLHSCTLGNDEPFLNPSPEILGSISNTFTSEQIFNLPLLGGIPTSVSCNNLQAPSLVQPTGDSIYGCTLHSSSILAPDEEMYIPIMETPGSDISFQDPTTINQQQVLQQESPMPHDLNIIKFLKKTGISNDQLLWDEHFNETIFHNNI